MHKFLMLNELEKRKIIKKKFWGMMFFYFVKQTAAVLKIFYFCVVDFLII